MGVSGGAGVGRGSPPWLTWLLVGGLVSVYVGERVLPLVLLARILFTGGGVLLVLAATLRRAAAWRSASGEARAVERLLLVTYVGCALALVGLLLAGGVGRALGVGGADFTAASRLRTALTVLSCIVLSASLLPALAAQWAMGFGPARVDRAGAVDHLRVSQVAAAGLTVGLALPLLMLAGYVASERDRAFDLSYFRTSSPGEVSVQVVEGLDEPLRVLLFFPPTSGVRGQVATYFRTLAGSVGNLAIEEHDRLSAPALAQEFGVVRDGTIILAVGARSERIVLPVLLPEARLQLRRFDGMVQEMLMRVARDDRMIYLTVGHGELNDALTASPLDTLGFGSVFALRTLIGQLNYRTRDLGLQSGLGSEVPPDAAMVMVLGPRRPFLDAELRTLDNYLQRGGSLLLALEPETDFDLGPLRERLGVDFMPTPLADENNRIAVRGDITDRTRIITDRVSSHAAVATVSQASVGSALAFFGAGYFEPFDFDRVTVLVHSMPTTFADLSGTLEFEPALEERRDYPLVAAVQGAGGMRSLLFADSEMFGDFVISRLGLNLQLVADALRWLGREEDYAGATASEEDVPIVHTRAENVAWFYSTILGAPALVLLFGLMAVRLRRRRDTSNGSVT